MTRDEILNMPAGREMDALIAEKVRGWTDIYYFKQEDTGPQSDCANGFDGKYYSAIPLYSTDMAAAWQVVEKLRTLGAWISVSITPGALTWDVRGVINEGQRGEKRFINHAPTAPLAICRAALLAMMDGDE